jgi:hypothetical protein
MCVYERRSPPPPKCLLFWIFSEGWMPPISILARNMVTACNDYAQIIPKTKKSAFCKAPVQWHGYPVYMVPYKFGTGLRFVLFRLFTCEFVLLEGLKFVRFRCSRVFTRPKEQISDQSQICPVPRRWKAFARKFETSKFCLHFSNNCFSLGTSDQITLLCIRSIACNICIKLLPIFFKCFEL